MPLFIIILSLLPLFFLSVSSFALGCITISARDSESPHHPSLATMPPKRKTPSLPPQNPKKPRTSSPPSEEDDEIPERVQVRHLFGGDKAKLALNLPPMHSLDDIFASITRHAMETGFNSFLDHMDTLERPLRVATVCSGTESPLLALEMVKTCKYPLASGLWLGVLLMVM